MAQNRDPRRTNTPHVAAVVDDNGRLQGTFTGRSVEDAKGEAQEFLNDCGGRVNHLRGASIVTGDLAKKAMQNGRI